MKDIDKTREQLIAELVEMRQRIIELEALDAKRKQAEEKLRKLYEQEREERIKLEREGGERLQFINALAHELKTPLTSIVASGVIA